MPSGGVASTLTPKSDDEGTTKARSNTWGGDLGTSTIVSKGFLARSLKAWTWSSWWNFSTLCIKGLFFLAWKEKNRLRIIIQNKLVWKTTCQTIYLRRNRNMWPHPLLILDDTRFFVLIIKFKGRRRIKTHVWSEKTRSKDPKPIYLIQLIYKG